MPTRLISYLLLFVWACQPAQRENPTSNVEGREITVKYAKGFNIIDYKDYVEVTIYRPYPGATEPLIYRLSRIPTATGAIDIPIDRLVCTSTTHLPALTMLDVATSLVGFPGTDYISDSIQWQRAMSGDLLELGTTSQLDIEQLVALEPDLVMAFSMGSETKQLDKLNELGVEVLYNGDYLEESILGRAEWVKVIGALYDQLDDADSIFNEIEKKYFDLKDKVTNITSPPSVLNGLMYGDAWFMPGGQNWGAQVVQEAGGEYLWAEDSSSGWIEVSFESVIDKAQNADFWIGIAHLESLDALSGADKRYEQFAPFSTGNVFSYGVKRGPGGGITYLELGYARPDIVLADMIKIIHPDLLPDHELYFYGQLK